MKVRVIVGFALLPLLIFILYFAPDWGMALVISLVSLLAVQELLGATRYVSKTRLAVYGMIMAASIPLWYFVDMPEGLGWLANAGIFVFVLTLSVEGICDPEKIKFEMISVVFAVSIFIPMLYSSLIRIADRENPLSIYIIIIPFIAAFGSDTTAFLTGRRLGKNKLAPLISPNKTVEGAIGGLAGAVTLMCLYGVVMQFCFSLSVNYGILIVYGLAGAAAAVIGDLAMSFVKREFGIKDFGNLLPGHGGVMDRFDGLLFAGPIIELLLLALPAVAL